MMQLVLHQWRYDMVAFWRNPHIFVSVFGDNTLKSGVEASTYYVPGLAALAVIASSFLNLVIAVTPAHARTTRTPNADSGNCPSS